MHRTDDDQPGSLAVPAAVEVVRLLALHRPPQAVVDPHDSRGSLLHADGLLPSLDGPIARGDVGVGGQAFALLADAPANEVLLEVVVVSVDAVASGRPSYVLPWLSFDVFWRGVGEIYAMTHELTANSLLYCAQVVLEVVFLLLLALLHLAPDLLQLLPRGGQRL